MSKYDDKDYTVILSDEGTRRVPDTMYLKGHQFNFEGEFGNWANYIGVGDSHGNRISINVFNGDFYFQKYSENGRFERQGNLTLGDDIYAWGSKMEDEYYRFTSDVATSILTGEPFNKMSKTSQRKSKTKKTSFVPNLEVARNYLEYKIKGWYANASIDYGVNGSLKSVDEDEEGNLIIRWVEDGVDLITAVPYYRDYSAEQIYNIWMEGNWDEDTTKTKVHKMKDFDEYPTEIQDAVREIFDRQGLFRNIIQMSRVAEIYEKGMSRGYSPNMLTSLVERQLGGERLSHNDYEDALTQGATGEMKELIDDVSKSLRNRRYAMKIDTRIGKGRTRKSAIRKDEEYGILHGRKYNLDGKTFTLDYNERMDEYDLYLDEGKDFPTFIGTVVGDTDESGVEDWIEIEYGKYRDKHGEVSKSKGIRLKGYNGTWKVIKSRGQFSLLESEQMGKKALNVILKGKKILKEVDADKDKATKEFFGNNDAEKCNSKTFKADDVEEDDVEEDEKQMSKSKIDKRMMRKQKVRKQKVRKALDGDLKDYFTMLFESAPSDVAENKIVSELVGRMDDDEVIQTFNEYDQDDYIYDMSEIDSFIREYKPDPFDAFNLGRWSSEYYEDDPYFYIDGNGNIATLREFKAREMAERAIVLNPQIYSEGIDGWDETMRLRDEVLAKTRKSKSKIGKRRFLKEESPKSDFKEMEHPQTDEKINGKNAVSDEDGKPDIIPEDDEMPSETALPDEMLNHEELEEINSTEDSAQASILDLDPSDAIDKMRNHGMTLSDLRDSLRKQDLGSQSAQVNPSGYPYARIGDGKLSNVLRRPTGEVRKF